MAADAQTHAVTSQHLALIVGIRLRHAARVCAEAIGLAWILSYRAVGRRVPAVLPGCRAACASCLTGLSGGVCLLSYRAVGRRVPAVLPGCRAACAACLTGLSGGVCLLLSYRAVGRRVSPGRIHGPRHRRAADVACRQSVELTLQHQQHVVVTRCDLLLSLRDALLTLRHLLVTPLQVLDAGDTHMRTELFEHYSY